MNSTLSSEDKSLHFQLPFLLVITLACNFYSFSLPLQSSKCCSQKSNLKAQQENRNPHSSKSVEIWIQVIMPDTMPLSTKVLNQKAWCFCIIPGSHGQIEFCWFGGGKREEEAKGREILRERQRQRKFHLYLILSSLQSERVTTGFYKPKFSMLILIFKNTSSCHLKTHYNSSQKTDVLLHEDAAHVPMDKI